VQFILLNLIQYLKNKKGRKNDFPATSLPFDDLLIASEFFFVNSPKKIFFLFSMLDSKIVFRNNKKRQRSRRQCSEFLFNTQSATFYFIN